MLLEIITNVDIEIMQRKNEKKKRIKRIILPKVKRI